MSSPNGESSGQWGSFTEIGIDGEEHVLGGSGMDLVREASLHENMLINMQSINRNRFKL